MHKRVDVAKLIELWPTRKPYKILEWELGHHNWVLIRKAREIGLKPRAWYWANDAKVDKRYANIRDATRLGSRRKASHAKGN